MQYAKRNNKIFYILLAIICLLSFVVPVSLAYFYDQNINSETGTIGQVKLNSGTTASFTSNFVVGENENILSTPISVSKDANSQSIYARVKVSVEFAQRAPIAGDVVGGVVLSQTNVQEITEWFNTLNENIVVTPSANSNIISGGTDSTVAWSKNAVNGTGIGNYYYLTAGTLANNSTLTLLSISNENAYKFCDANGISFSQNINSLTLSNASGNFENKLNLKLVVEFEAMQSNYIELSDATAPKWNGGWTNQVTIQTSVASSSSTFGTIVANPTTLTAGSNSILTITSITGYEIDKLLINGTDFASQVVNNQLTLTNVYENLNIVASFKKIGLQISVSSSVGGAITPTTTRVDYGANKTFTITPNIGYAITNVLVDGATQGAISSYTFSNVTSAHTISATFAIQSYNFALNSGTGISSSALTFLDYIQTTSNSSGYGVQYFDTGVKPTINTRVVMDYETQTTGVWLFGSRNGGGATDTFGIYLNNATQYWLQYGGNSTTTTGGYFSKTTTGRHTLDVSYKKFIYDNNEQAFTANNGLTNGTYNICLGSINMANSIDSRVFHGKIYSFKIYENNVLVRDFIPAQMGSVVGLYDAVNGIFYAHGGATGTALTAGSSTNGSVHFGQKICIDASVAEGYDWNSWSVSGTTPLTFNASARKQTIVMNTGSVVLTASATIKTFAVTLNSPANGTISTSPAVVAYGSPAVLTITPSATYKIDTLTINNVSIDLATITNNGDGSFSYTIPNIQSAQDVVVSFTQITFAVTLTNNTPDFGTISASATTVVVGSNVVLTITPNANYEIDTLTINGVAIAISASAATYTIENVQSTQVVVIVFKSSIYTRFTQDGINYIWFGKYAQTEKASDVTISGTAGNYVGSDGNGYEYNSTNQKYYKIEPILWRILSESNGTAFLLSEKLLDKKMWSSANSLSYAASDVRKWLNGNSTTNASSDLSGTGFYQKAFTAAQQNIIQTTTVDNTTASGASASYANTQDKVFLLSYNDAINTAYGFNSNRSNNDFARRKIRTDYATANGATYSYWWLRSPQSYYTDPTTYTTYYYIYRVTDLGDIWSVWSREDDYGVAPALKITLAE